MTEKPPLPTSPIAPTLRSAALVAVPAVIGEAVQHLIEYKIGMYVVGDGIGVGQEERWRTIGVVIKIIGFLCTITRARARSDFYALNVHLTHTTKIVSLAMLVFLHYVLNYAAVGKESWIVLVAILLDSLVIGALASALGIFLPKSWQRSRAR